MAFDGHWQEDAYSARVTTQLPDGVTQAWGSGRSAHRGLWMTFTDLQTQLKLELKNPPRSIGWSSPSVFATQFLRLTQVQIGHVTSEGDGSGDDTCNLQCLQSSSRLAPGSEQWAGPEKHASCWTECSFVWTTPEPIHWWPAIIGRPGALWGGPDPDRHMLDEQISSQYVQTIRWKYHQEVQGAGYRKE